MRSKLKIFCCIFFCLALLFAGVVVTQATSISTTFYKFNTQLGYLWYINTTQIPDHFVTYEQINASGEFDFISFYKSEVTGKDPWSSYFYELAFGDGSSVLLNVSHTSPFTYDVNLPELPQNVNDVRDFKASEDCTQVRLGEITYGFMQDKTGEYILHTITMFIDGTRYYWSLRESQYPADSLIERLLYTDTAEDAYAEFAASVRCERSTQLGWKILFFGTPVVVVGGVVAFFVIRKKKAKAKANT